MGLEIVQSLACESSTDGAEDQIVGIADHPMAQLSKCVIQGVEKIIG